MNKARRDMLQQGIGLVGAATVMLALLPFPEIL